jgi:tetraacyldisaccharide 4'-kinase
LRTIKKKIIIFVQKLWDKTKNLKPLTSVEKMVFAVFCLFEVFYRAGFCLINKCKKVAGGQQFNSFKIISIGNLSLGGTGKSVLSQFLVSIQSKKQGAVVARGYRGKSKKNFLISDGKRFFCDVSFCGDEAFMLAKHQIPVVVGKDRADSCKLLERFCREKNKNIDYVVLDDAYQNHHVKKDFEILLLDASFPFENEHCFPAGRLREKDFFRADAIILTRAMALSKKEQQSMRSLLAPFDQTKIFFGTHVSRGLFLQARGKNCAKELFGKRALIFSGIGNPQSFGNMVKEEGLETSPPILYEDHHCYTKRDLASIYASAKKHRCEAIVTTEKDWYKIAPLVIDLREAIPIYVLFVGFEFLFKHEYASFKFLMNEKLGWK